MVSTSVLKPSGTGFGWCINQYDGCAHGCRYCYGMVTRRKSYSDWLKPRRRERILEGLEKDIRILANDGAVIRDIFVGSITDSYQPIERECLLTRQVLDVLIQNEMPFTILTKSDLVLRDIDLFKNYAKCRVGVTITSLDENFRRTLEPFSVEYNRRIAVLEELKANGVSTYLSCEPIIPVTEVDPIEIVNKTEHAVDLFEFGMWNKYRKQGIPEYYFKHYDDKYYVNLFSEIIAFCDEKGINYCLASHSKEFVETHGLNFRPYPTVIA